MKRSLADVSTNALFKTAIATALSATTLGTAASASAFTVNQNRSLDLLHALLGDTTGLSNFQVSATNEAAAFGLFDDDPFGLGSGIALSTGKVVDLPGQNTVDGGIVADYTNVPNDLSTDFGTAGAGGDSIALQISFDADATVEKLFFNYVFGSEEFVEFGGTMFNDSFSLSLNGQNLAKLSDGQTVSINNLIPNPSDPSSYHADYINNPAGSGVNTKLDGYTKILGFEGALLQNQRNVLTINVRDFGDGLLDSAVFIQAATLGTRDPDENWTSTPEPGTIAALFGIGGAIAVLKRRAGDRA